MLVAAAAAPVAWGQSAADLMAGAKREGKLVSYGMSDDWVNFENVFKAIEQRYGVKHTDTDMTSAEEITRLLAERNAPVMDIADIGYDFLGRLLENNLAMPYRNAHWDKIPNQFKDPEGRWAVSYWGAISFLVNTDQVKTMPETWNDLLKPDYKDMVCSRDPRVSTYATASVLAAAYANGGGEAQRPARARLVQAAPGHRQPPQGRGAERGVGPEGRVPDLARLRLRRVRQAGRHGPAAQGDHPEGRDRRHAVRAVHQRRGARIRTRPRWPIDFFFSDEGQVLLAAGLRPSVAQGGAPADVARRCSRRAPTARSTSRASLPAFSAAIKKIADGWSAIVGQ